MGGHHALVKHIEPIVNKSAHCRPGGIRQTDSGIMKAETIMRRAGGVSDQPLVVLAVGRTAAWRIACCKS
jgi:hypothetical protein